MTTVRDYKDARFWEFVLRTDAIKNADRIAEVKKALRAFYHKGDEYPEMRVFCNDNDGAIELYPLPDDIKTEEEAVDYFMEYEYIHYRPTYYDCTGQVFTSRFKVFNRFGQFWVYHILSRDV